MWDSLTESDYYTICHTCLFIAMSYDYLQNRIVSTTCIRLLLLATFIFWPLAARLWSCWFKNWILVCSLQNLILFSVVCLYRIATICCRPKHVKLVSVVCRNVGIYYHYITFGLLFVYLLATILLLNIFIVYCLKPLFNIVLTLLTITVSW